MTSPGPAADLATVVAAVHGRYDPSAAESWDAVGLVCGDPAQPVRRVLFAVDAVAATVTEALEADVDLLITHHPLLFHPVTSVAATTTEGVLVHRLVLGRCALLAAHTNADVARDGVSDALAAAVGLGATRPVVPSASVPGTGLGRIGDLEVPTDLGSFAAAVLAALPATAHGVRIAGDLDRSVRRVAVCGGSGSDVIPHAAEMGADVVITADLKHHVALDHLSKGGPALLDVSHWASEWPWLRWAADRLVADLLELGVTVDTRVSRIVTDPWTARL